MKSALYPTPPSSYTIPHPVRVLEEGMEGDVPEERDNAENDEGGEGHEAALPRAVVGVGDLQLELLVHHHVDKEPGVLGHPLDALLEGAGRGRGRGQWR